MQLAHAMGMTATNEFFNCEVPVFFATTEGQTRRIAQRLATVFHGHGIDSRAIDVAGPAAALVDWTKVRGALVGASLHIGKHQKAADRFVLAYASDLNAVPSAFFSVSLSAASKNEKEVDTAESLARAFPAARGWTPELIVSLAGRLAYREYGLLIRWVMRQIARKEGAPTDTSRDYELTDWTQVEQLAHEMARRIHTREAVV
jgi:menaquinone-dependent protoporphyrinogen oxidase